MSNHKRKFTPVATSSFNPTKKFKFQQSSTQDALQTSFTSATSSSSYQFRAKATSSGFTPTVPQPFNLQTEARSRKSSLACANDVQMMSVESRPKFKAKPMPRFSDFKEISRSSSFNVSGESNFIQNRAGGTYSFEEDGGRGVSGAGFDHSNRFLMQRSGNCNNGMHAISLESLARSRSSGSSDANSFRFVAKPMPNFNNVFVPVTNFEPTQPINFELNTQKRAVEREKFESIVKDKENLINEIKQEQARIESEEIKSYRKTLEFKARPLQELKPFLVKRSQDELTRPKSPVLMTKFRAVMKDIEVNDMMDID